MTSSRTLPSVGFVDRALHGLGNLLVFGPLRNTLGLSRVRVAYTAGEAIGPDLFSFYRSIGINLKQLYGSTETAVFVCMQPDNEARAAGHPDAAQAQEVDAAQGGQGRRHGSHRGGLVGRSGHRGPPAAFRTRRAMARSASRIPSEAEAADMIERDPAQAQRFFGNQIVYGAGTWLKEGLWDRARVPEPA